MSPLPLLLHSPNPSPLLLVPRTTVSHSLWQAPTSEPCKPRPAMLPQPNLPLLPPTPRTRLRLLLLLLLQPWLNLVLSQQEAINQ